jgi:hypothetical protein
MPLTAELARGASLLDTMGCGDECPYVPGLRRDDWAFQATKGLPRDEVRRIRDEIRDRVSALIECIRMATRGVIVSTRQREMLRHAEGGAKSAREVRESGACAR